MLPSYTVHKHIFFSAKEKKKSYNMCTEIASLCTLFSTDHLPRSVTVSGLIPSKELQETMALAETLTHDVRAAMFHHLAKSRHDHVLDLVNQDGHPRRYWNDPKTLITQCFQCERNISCTDRKRDSMIYSKHRIFTIRCGSHITASFQFCEISCPTCNGK